MAGTISARRSPVESRAALPGQLLLQYVGFQDTPARREYVLLAQMGDRSRRYTVWIEQAAFADRKALRQDGPDICFQKLQRELPESDLAGTACIGVTEGDLARYRQAHNVPKRRAPTPRPAASETSPGSFEPGRGEPA